MADLGTGQVIEGLNNINNTLQQNAASTDQTGMLQSLSDIKDGLHELRDKQLEVTISELPPEIQQVCDALLESLENVKKMTDMMDKKDVHDKEVEAKATKDVERGKNDFSENDLSSMPAEVSAAPMYIGKILQELLGESSPLISKLEEALGGAETEATQEGEGAQGPSLDFQDEGWKKLAETITLFAETSENLTTEQIEAGKEALTSISDFIESSKEMFSDLQLDDAQIETVTQFTDSLKTTFDNIASLTTNIQETSTQAMDSIQSLESIKQFTTDAATIGDNIPEAETLENVNEYTTALSDVFTAVSETMSAAAQVSDLSQSATDALGTLQTFFGNIQTQLDAITDISNIDEANYTSSQLNSIFNDIAEVTNSVAGIEDVTTATANTTLISAFLTSSEEVVSSLQSLTLDGAADNAEELQMLILSSVQAAQELNGTESIFETASTALSSLSQFITSVGELDVSQSTEVATELEQFGSSMQTATDALSNIDVTQAAGSLEEISSLTEQISDLDVSSSLESSEQLAQLGDALSSATNALSNIDTEGAVESLEGISNLTDTIANIDTESSIASLEGVSNLVDAVNEIDVESSAETITQLEQFGTSFQSAIESISSIGNTINDALNSLDTIGDFVSQVGEIDVEGSSENISSLQDFAASISSAFEDLSGIADTASEATDALSGVDAFFEGINNLTASTEGLGEQVAGLQEVSQQSAQALQSVNDAITTLGQFDFNDDLVSQLTQVSDILTQVGTVGDTATEIQDSISGLASTSEQIGSSITSLADALGGISQLTEQNISAESLTPINDVLQSFGTLGETAATNTEQLSNLSAFSEEVSNSLSSLQDVANIVNDVSTNLTNSLSGLNDIQSLIDGMSFNAESITTVFESLGEAGSSSADFVGDIESLSETSAASLGAISDIDEMLGKAADLSEQISTTFENIGNISDSLNENLANIQNLSEVTDESKEAFSSLSDLVETINAASDSLNNIVDVSTGFESINQFRDVVNALVEINEQALNIDGTQDLIDNITGMVGELGKLGEAAGELEAFRVTLETNIIEPLTGLEEPISNIERLRDSVRDLNSELSKMSKDNTDTLKSLNSQEGGGVLGGQGEAFQKSDTTMSGEGDSKEVDILMEISDTLKQIASGMNPPEKGKSWTEGSDGKPKEFR